MAAFSAIAAILAVVVFAAVLWPLWRESRGVVFGAVVVLVLAALATYKLVGTPEAIDAPAAAVDATPRTIEEAVCSWRPNSNATPDAPPAGSCWRARTKCSTAGSRPATPTHALPCWPRTTPTCWCRQRRR